MPDAFAVSSAVFFKIFFSAVDFEVNTLACLQMGIILVNLVTFRATW